MNVYKITFVKNVIDSCKLVSDTVMEGNITYQKHNGFLIYALIKAENETIARQRAADLLAKI